MEIYRCTCRWLFFFSLISITFASYTLGTEMKDSCDALVDHISHGEILWTENAIVVQGTAAPNLADPEKPITAIKREAQRSATLDAYRKVAEILAGVHITSNTLVADRPEVISRLRAYVRNPQICQTKFYADGGVDIVIMVPLKGALLKALLPKAGSKVAASKSSFTGIIVDATQLTFTPSIAPRFLGPDGTVLFSQESVKIKALTDSGPVRYYSDKKDIQEEWIGNHPLEVKAVALGSMSPCDLVLNEKDASELAKSPSFLGEGKVVIITPKFHPVECQDLFMSVTDQSVNWERRLVLARGLGKVDFSGKEDDSVRLRMMERAAEVDAQRKLLDSLLSLKTDENRTLSKTPKAKNILEGIVRNAVRCGSKYYKDGTSEIVMAVPIDGSTAKVEQLGRMTPSLTPISETRYGTGLIIEASGLSFEPTLAPVLVTSEGDIIYSHEMVASAWIQQHGVAGYSPSIKEAKSDSRVGNHPIVIKAREYISRSNHLVLEPIDSTIRSQLKQMDGVFSQGRVIIVTTKLVEDKN